MSIFGKIGSGLAATRRALSEGLQALFVDRPKMDPQTFDRLEEILIGADLGVDVTRRFLDGLRAAGDSGEVTDAAGIKRKLSAYVITVLQKGVAQPPLAPPAITLFVGVNGVGKTTTIGKRAQQLRRAGRTVLLAAGDTFRAGAIEQLQIWGERVGAEVICHQVGADPAAVVYDAVCAARARGIDALLIDTAGRLQTRSNLMAELAKMQRVISKAADAPYERTLVLDATTGQNALSQARLFHQQINVTSVILTKLDGTARGGIVVPVVEEIVAPVTHIGVGEGVDDLVPFDIPAFAAGLVDDPTR